MSRPVEVRDENYSIGKGYGITYKEVDNSDEKVVRGKVYTVHGIVSVYSTYFKNKNNTKVYQHSMLNFIYQSRVYHRTFRKFYSGRYLVTLAKRFAEDIVDSFRRCANCDQIKHIGCWPRERRIFICEDCKENDSLQDKPDVCKSCDGHGFYRFDDGDKWFEEVCDDCNGSGVVSDD